MKEFLLIGYPLKYSLSPKIYNAFFEKKRLKLNYKIKAISPNTFTKDIFKILLNKNLIALNITNPYKQKILQYINKKSIICDKTSCSNLVIIKNNRLYSYNTDYKAFKYILKKLNVGKVLLLGTGAIGKSILYLLKEKNIDCQILYNQHPLLDNSLKQDSIKKIKDFLPEYDTVVNCTTKTFDFFIKDLYTIKDKIIIDFPYINKEKVYPFFYINGKQLLNIQIKYNLSILSNFYYGKDVISF